jgi:RNA recognition motif-containing protein
VPVGVPQPINNPYVPQSTVTPSPIPSSVATPFSSSLLLNPTALAMAAHQPALNAQDKINRELFVGNVPPGTSEALLMQFLNGAMRRVGLCGPTEPAIVSCRTNAKFAFIECANFDMTGRALNLNGIPFLGACLRVSRPSKYAGPHTPSQTWQQLTGQPLPPGMTAVPENINPASGGMIVPSSNNPEEKLQRELFVGNTTPEMTEVMLRDFLGRALEQVGLTIMPGNPIVACRVSGKFAFVELRTKEEAANALNLNNIPYLGAQLRVGRPSKYTGPLTPHGNWEDILAKFMSGELQLKQHSANNAASAIASSSPIAASAPAAAVVDQRQPTTVVELKQMLTLKDLVDDAEYEDILEDTRDECSPFGTLKNVVIPRSGPGATKIFLEYSTVEDAGRAIAGLAGRTFDGRKVEAVYFNPVKFASQDYSD